MTLLFKRFIGVLALDSGTFEEIEADHRAGMQSVAVVMLVCLAGGLAAIGLGSAGVPGFAAGVVVALGAWLVWATSITTLGTVVLAEPATKSELNEILRVLGFAAAPGVFIAFAALQPVAAPVVVVVTAWTIAASVIAVRQALDFRSTWRAIAVCIAAGLLSLVVVWSVLMTWGVSVR